MHMMSCMHVDVRLKMAFSEIAGSRCAVDYRSGNYRKMEITFNTQNVDATVALKALRLYKDRNFKEAIPAFTDILDAEPGNWDARLLLGACYYKTEQYVTAQRIFRYIAESCTSFEIRSKALAALQDTTSRLEKRTVECPPEFGAYANRVTQGFRAQWLDHV